ncbi:MAG: 4'-phosphopantetheinyl transferase [Rickettsiaceae bacterium]
MIKILRKIQNEDLKNYLNRGFVMPQKLKNAVFKRQNEFASGRLCALEALERLLGNFKGSVGQDNLCRPIWPIGISGSISHCDNYSVSVVAFKKNALSLGVDIEEISSCVNKIEAMRELVITNYEHNFLECINLKRDLHIIYLIFSAKESFFKCINPINDMLFDFKEIEVYDINFRKSSFKIRLINNRVLSKIPRDIKSICGNFDILFGGKAIYTKVDLVS